MWILFLKEPCSSGRSLLLFSSTPRNETGDMPRENCQTVCNAMMDYSMVKCKLTEPRIGTGYTFSERSKFHGFFSDPLKWRIWSRYQASTVRRKRFFKTAG